MPRFKVFLVLLEMQYRLLRFVLPGFAIHES
jgi:hypothetical protein